MIPIKDTNGEGVNYCPFKFLNTSRLVYWLVNLEISGKYNK